MTIMKTLMIYALAMSLFSLNAQTKIIPGPIGTVLFGKNVYVLTNGNYVVVNPEYDKGAISNAGAVFLYDGINHTLISTLTGSKTNDLIGYNGVVALPNGNYVVQSSYWDNGSVIDAGAITWCSGTTGINGVVSISNSLVGSTANDNLGSWNTTILKNGNYVVQSISWDNGAMVDAGAITWCSGLNGRSGIINSSNSIVGSKAGELSASGVNVWVLTNGNYVVSTSQWDNGAILDVGAVTWCNGTTGRSGNISASNSFIGSTTNDNVGQVVALPNGNYLICSYYWDNGANVDAGAITWCNGTTGSVGIVGSSNSIVGSSGFDHIGNYTRIALLSNGNYIVHDPEWDNGPISDAGFARWCNGNIGTVGAINSVNSLVGVNSGDQVGELVVALNNGNYVVVSSNWDNGAIVNAGAVTWANGTSGITGTISSSNSFLGSTANERMGVVYPLLNGNYVVTSRGWDNGALANAGAVTWCNGATGRTGYPNTGNSMIGGIANSNIAFNINPSGNSISALPNGNYLINSPKWSNGSNTETGALTWCSGTNVSTGVIGINNSLVGSTSGDHVGYSVKVLSNSNYIALSPDWTNGLLSSAGAATFCNGNTGRTGPVNSTNSLVGALTGNKVGSNDAIELANGHYLVLSDQWGNSLKPKLGAVTWCDGTTGRIGAVNETNSLIGTSANDNIGYSASALVDGNYCIRSSIWDNGVLVDAGAYTISKGANPIIGEVNSCNSILGSIANPSNIGRVKENTIHKHMIVALPSENKIIIVGYNYPNSVFPKTICANESFVWNDASLSTAGNYKDTLQTVLGCDSIVTLNLSITPTPIKTTTISGTSITADESSASYQWIDCNANAPIAGETNQTFIASRNGSYKVAVTKSSCTEFSDCVNIVGASILSAKESNNVSIYPNPSNGSFTLTSAEDGIYNVLNEFGQIVNTFELNEKTKPTHKIEQLPAGIYFVKNLNTMSTGQKIVVLHGE